MHDGIFFHILIEVGVEIVPTHFLACIVIIKDFMGGGPQRPPPQSWLCKKSPVWVGLTPELDSIYGPMIAILVKAHVFAQ